MRSKRIRRQGLHYHAPSAVFPRPASFFVANLAPTSRRLAWNQRLVTTGRSGDAFVDAKSILLHQEPVPSRAHLPIYNACILTLCEKRYFSIVNCLQWFHVCQLRLIICPLVAPGELKHVAIVARCCKQHLCLVKTALSALSILCHILEETTIFCLWKANNLPLPPGCVSQMVGKPL